MDQTPPGFDRFLRQAGRLLGNRSQLLRLLGEAARKPLRGSALAEVREDLGTLLRLIRARVAGDYTDVAPQTMVSVVAGILYFVMPLDIVPDFIIGVGLLDDAAVIGYVVSRIGGELETFCEWEQQGEVVEVTERLPASVISDATDEPTDPRLT